MSLPDLLDNVTLVVPRRGPNTASIVHSKLSTNLPPDHILIRVDAFGFSYNNVTYQALGDEPHFRYFDFHSAPVDAETCGVVPVWGFGTIIKSSVPGVQALERIFGYLAPARYIMLPIDSKDMNKFNLNTPRPHLPPDRRPYNQLTRTSADPLHSSGDEDLAMLLRPLFWTSFWCEDWLFHSTSKPYDSAELILISSASAKTAYLFAYVLRRRQVNIRIVGLTSTRNKAFVESLELYDDILTYDNLSALKSSIGAQERPKWLYVDVAGNATLNTGIADALGGDLRRTISLGLTNLSPGKDAYVQPPSGVTSSSSTISDPLRTSFFFMPEWLAERRSTIGTRAIAALQKEGWTALMRDCRAGRWISVERSSGARAIEQGYRKVVTGDVNPRAGMVWSLWDRDEERTKL